MGLGGRRHAPAALPREGPSVHYMGGWVSSSVWTDAENLAPTGIRSTDRPAHSESLYRVRYPGSHTITVST